MPISPPPTPRCSAYHAASAWGSRARKAMAPIPFTPMVDRSSSAAPGDLERPGGVDQEVQGEQDDEQEDRDPRDVPEVARDVRVLLLRVERARGRVPLARGCGANLRALARVLRGPLLGDQLRLELGGTLELG